MKKLIFSFLVLFGSASHALDFIWPTISTVNEPSINSKTKGLAIYGLNEDPVWAVESGVVLYAGAGLKGYGNIVLIRHSDAFISAYANNKRLVVKEDQKVSKGQLLAYMGDGEMSASGRVMLHFEMRQNGINVEPIKFLQNPDNYSPSVASLDASKNQCITFGFIETSTEHSNCVLQLELAKKQSFENDRKYRLDREIYQRQISALEREKQRQRGTQIMELGARLMNGQRPIDALSSLGTGTPIAPSRPNPINQTITLPNGRMINCSTMGTMTNCF